MKRLIALGFLTLLAACGGSGSPGGDVQNILQRFDIPPDTEPLATTVKSSAALAHIVTAATAEMFGDDIDFVQANVTCTSFPCAVTADITLSDDSIIRPHSSATSAQVAAFWPSETQGVMVVLLYGGVAGSSNYPLQSIHSFPVSRIGSDLLITFADVDIDIDGEADDPAALSTSEVALELERLNTPIPTEYEVAVGMDAWVVEVFAQGTTTDLSDDRILISGGGQYVAVDGTSVDVYQLGLVSVEMNATCAINPLGGLAIIQAVDTREFVVGQAVLEFDQPCNGRAKVLVANGNYIGTIGDNIPLSF